MQDRQDRGYHPLPTAEAVDKKMLVSVARRPSTTKPPELRCPPQS